MRKFLYRLILVLLPVVSIPIVNYTVDPSHVYDGYDQKIVSILQQHPYVINVDPNLDERNFKKSLVDSCKEDVDILVLGSSRVMLISEQMFNGESLLNLGVSGATYEDVTALLHHYMTSGKCPRKIILGLDPQHFNANIGDTRWMALRNDYAAYDSDVLKNSIEIEPNYDKWLNLVSITYFQNALKCINRNSVLQPIDSVILGKDIHDGNGVGKDGSLIYGSDFESRWPIEMSNNNAKNVAYPQWDNYTQLSEVEIERWQNLIEYIQGKGIQLYFIRAAYHPILYNRLVTDDKYMMMKKGMDYIERLAKINSIELIGSFNPNDDNFKSKDFYDGMHMRQETMERIITESH